MVNAEEAERVRHIFAVCAGYSSLSEALQNSSGARLDREPVDKPAQQNTRRAAKPVDAATAPQQCAVSGRHRAQGSHLSRRAGGAGIARAVTGGE